ncbi:MAG: hypothetical protein NZ952_04435 [Candidatus Bathyarchaeota archaeon]|nr:hypothetical protein [Candidatus Bathyarchaeota archaeon]
MKSRERLLAALRHEEPDRVPIDLGALRVSGIDAIAYRNLRKFLGLPEKPIRLAPQTFTNTMEYASNLAEVEKEVLDLFHVDVININRVLPPCGPLVETTDAWKRWTVDNTILEAHEKVNIIEDEDGWLLHFPQSPLTPAEKRYKMLKKDFICVELWRGEAPLKNAKSVDEVEDFDWEQFRIRDEVLEGMRRRGEHLCMNTDYGLVLFDVGSLHANVGQVLRGWSQWLIDLKVRRALAEAILDNFMEVLMHNISRLIGSLGDYVQVIGFADDLGSQEGPQISPKTFTEIYKHRYEEVFSYIKRHSKMFILLHSDGAISHFLKDLTDIGLDAINPVQFTAKNMDPLILKKEFGEQLSFWGGGADTQDVLPHGDTQTVEKHVKDLVSIFAPGGGYVFAAVHMIPGKTPPENIVTAFKAAYEIGKYPIKMQIKDVLR